METVELNKPILEIRKVSKDFSGVYALNNVDMQVFPGQVTAVIGENGAGKSTLMKIVSGVHHVFEGEVLFSGTQIDFNNPREAAQTGIVIIHQELNLIPHLSVTENLFLGQEITNKFGFLDYSQMHRKAHQLLKRLQLDVDPRTPVYRLRVGQQQLVEIARALLFESKVLIMDEPTSAISDHEVELLFQIIQELKKQGVAILYISHKLDEIFQICDRFEVLRDGIHVGSGMISEVDRDHLIRLMVGRTIQEREEAVVKNDLEEILRIESFDFRNPENKSDFLVHGVSFTLHKGEVLGVAGLMGAGRSELLEAIFGLHPNYVRGAVFIEGHPVKIGNVNDAITAGIALVPEDRKTQGLILNMSVSRNTSLASLKRVSALGFINRKKEEKLSNSYVAKLKTSVPSRRIAVEKLSGGNQQKVVLAKWLATNPKILLLDEPTRGIDVGAKAEIYKLISELAKEGMGIVVVSSELPEILAVSDTILVLSESKLTAKFTRDEATEEKIMTAALKEKD